MHPVSRTNTHRDVTDLISHGMVKNTKTWERNTIFLRNKKILNLCFRWHILRSYHFVAEVNFNSSKRIGSDVQITKAVNNNLIKQLKNNEKQCWTNTQYLRRECVEIIGRSKTAESMHLEHTVCKVFNSIGFDIEEDRLNDVTG